MTLTKLAKLANVSVSTASKAFSMSSEVNEETRKIIFDIAKEHGCFKKYYNANYPKLVIAIICPDMITSSSLVKTLQARLAEHNCETCVTASNFSRERELELIEYYENYVKVDGLILLSPKCMFPRNLETPVAVLDPYNEAQENENIIVAMRSVDEAYKEAINYFVDRGVMDIAFIGDRLSVSKSQLYRHFMNEKFGSVDESKISINDDMSANGGYESMNTFLNKGYVPRALISAYFNYTLGAVKAITERGLRIPEDIAIISFTNSDSMEYTHPGFTGIESYDGKICIRMADALINKINGLEYEKKLIFHSKIKYRKSSEL